MHNKLSKKTGMTMAEVLLTIGIIAILSGVIFISVINHQRNLAFFECNKIAKEIFIAAQNHLTIAKGQNYPGCPCEFIKPETETDKEEMNEYAGTPNNNEGESYHIIVNAGNLFHNNGNGSYMLKKMLPFGSLDDTVRIGGNYIINYQPQTGKILDVFYSSAPPEKYSYSSFNENDYSDLMEITDNEEKRKEYSEEKAVIGWYGGENLSSLGYTINSPALTIENSNKLIANINWNDNTKDDDGIILRLLIKGKQSGAEANIPISQNTDDIPSANDLIDDILNNNKPAVKREFSYVLDDISISDEHFAKKINNSVVGETKFIPGEDLEIKAVAYSTEFTGNIAESNTVLTNSLFDYISNESKDDDSYTMANDGTKIIVNSTSVTAETNNKPNTAYISCIRHLENLDNSVSNLEANDFANSKINISKAIQIKDLDWNDYTGEAVSYGMPGILFNPVNYTNNNCYKPIKTKNDFTYNGKNLEIKNIKVVYDNDAGVFSSLKNGTIKNIKITNPDITCISEEKNAGALAGAINGTSVENIVGITSSDHNKISIQGNTAGGLIGNMTGGFIKYSAASLRIKGINNAGGLVGTGTGNIKGCYSGGHTNNGKYSNEQYDIFSQHKAGGLIGYLSAFSGSVSNSYSTCSVSSPEIAGGFIGENTNSVIQNCYCTGLVSKNGKAFIAAGNAGPNNKYYALVNDSDKDEDDKMLPGDPSVTALDENTESFAKTTVAGADNKTVKYDTSLKGPYIFKMVFDLDSELPQKYFVNKHFGDWPQLEKFVINK